MKLLKCQFRKNRLKYRFILCDKVNEYKKHHIPENQIQYALDIDEITGRVINRIIDRPDLLEI